MRRYVSSPHELDWRPERRLKANTRGTKKAVHIMEIGFTNLRVLTKTTMFAATIVAMVPLWINLSI
jgi:hypothetical protein